MLTNSIKSNTLVIASASRLHFALPSTTPKQFLTKTSLSSLTPILGNRVGIASNIKVKAERVLGNGRRAISLVNYGLNFLADAILNPLRPAKFNAFDFFHDLDHC